ncbi:MULTISPECIES: cupin domain-containing protein [unclassified Rhodococcus (in: high G+C Gram-positive bacteria)]|uniref:cupin domain-containing protein n=1 Tax=unclassified Rhodococcus (in: high G+C Gram-positive bacteria) TaxID=192944 RepID=UPI0011EC39C8|nr:MULTISPECIES: cupin domain-containing protein [unclassified Rhodococcus (in: high G+C Gram-positive bacteria)]KAA0926327.1 cupin [Rhodococcus sp. ANT_H53B]MDI9924468.1 cupin domain-containing protein [Rhodococcus sp. IEGM 1341]
MSTESSGERGSDNRSALRRLTGTDFRTFADRFWGTAPKLTRSAELSDSFDDLMTLDAVDELISERGVRTPFVRMAKDGRLLDKSQFTSSGGFGAEITDQVDSAAVLAAFAAGNTLVLQGLHRLWPPLIHFVGDLVRELGHPVQVNSYVTPAASQGFSPHYDVHDVFVVQIAGTKRWSIHSPVHVHPLNNQPWSDRRSAVEDHASNTPELDVVLEPGDVLYLPRGWIHSAQALGDTTVHLTIGVASYNDYDLAHHVLKSLGDVESLRAPLPAGLDHSDPESIAAHVHRVVDAMRAALDEIDRDPDAIRRLAERVADRHDELVRPEPVRPLASVAAMGALRGEDSIRLRSGVFARVVRSAHAVSVVVRTKTVTMPPQCADALDLLNQGAPCRLDALPGLDTDDALVVARRLIREGIAVPAER